MHNSKTLFCLLSFWLELTRLFIKQCSEKKHTNCVKIMFISQCMYKTNIAWWDDTKGNKTFQIVRNWIKQFQNLVFEAVYFILVCLNDNIRKSKRKKKRSAKTI